MQYILIFFFTLLLITGCDSGKKSRELRQKETELTQREQDLAARDQALNLREDALNQKVRITDSTVIADTANTAPPAITGKWTAQMTCTETTCAGSAVGDTKTEQWEITYQGGTFVARAMANGQLVRVYTGSYTDGTIELTEELASSASSTPAKMMVRLKPVSESRMEGQREIVRENNCRILYDLQLDANTK